MDAHGRENAIICGGNVGTTLVSSCPSMFTYLVKQEPDNSALSLHTMLKVHIWKFSVPQQKVFVSGDYEQHFVKIGVPCSRINSSDICFARSLNPIFFCKYLFLQRVGEN